jgi:cell fate regulator YaaT (PSP1 superfamily)
MGCGNCSSGANGKPGGCKGNGGCSTGGCNRLNVYDWLAELPLHDGAKPYPVIEVSFNKGSRKEFFRNNTHHILEKGDWFAVEGVGGYDVGQVSLTGELVKLQLKKYGVREVEVNKRILHPATDEELEQFSRQKDREAEILVRSRAIARSLNLEMKICEVEVQADSKKGTFFYTADQRVDFRELIKLFAGDFKMKVEMKQIGARQESGKVGGIGSCGRELCCSTWLTDFKSVNTTAARYQNLSINQTKLSGQCGRLKCCLNYELDTYMDALSVFPDHVDHLETVKGVAHLQKRDIFKNLMWYSYSDNNKQYPLTIERVKQIQKINKLGQKADELAPVELETKDSKAGIKADMGYVNDVGQITLKNLEHKNKKKKGGGNKGGGQQPQRAQAGKSPEEGDEQQQKSRPQQGNKPQQPRNPNNQQQKQAAGQGDKPQNKRPNKPQNRPAPQPAGAEGTPEAGSDRPQGNKQQQGKRPQQNRPAGQQQKQNQPRRPDNQGPRKVPEGPEGDKN